MKPSHDADERLRRLTRREREVLSLLGQGHSMPEIAAVLGRSIRTIQAHRYSLGRKLAVKSSVSLARLAIEFGLAPIKETDSEENKKPSSEQRAEEALAIIEAGISAVADDAEYLDHLVRHLARALDVKCALLAEMTQGQTAEVIVLSGWHEGRAMQPQRFLLNTCPFAEQPVDRVHRISSGLAAAYPDCRFIQEGGFDFYLGMALSSGDGRHIATLAVLNDSPVDSRLYPELILKIFAGRAAAELERRRARQELRLSEARYRGIVEEGGNPVCRFAADSRITFANSAMAELLGRPLAEIVGRKLMHFVTLPDQQVLRRLIDCLHPTDRSRVVAMSLPGSDSARHRWSIQGIFSGDGTLAEYQAIVQREERDAEQP